ncbi:MAG: PIN domain-containing protein [Acidimicrobiales bacterium]
MLRNEPGDLVIPAPISAEVDYLLGRRLGRGSRLAFLDDLATGRFTVAHMDANDYRVVADLERRYEDLDVGLSDLSVVVAARRYGTRRLLTFDDRRFRALRPLDGGHFTLLPAGRQHHRAGSARNPSAQLLVHHSLGLNPGEFR